MRGGRSFLILLVVALGLGAYIYFVESKREPAGETAAVKKDKVFSIDSSKFEEIEIHAASGETTTLKKKNGLWEIVAPEAMTADSGEVGGLLSSLESLEIQSVVDENPASAADFGLDPPRFSVAFKAAGAAALTRLQVGKKTPTGGDLYARVEGQPRVFLISGYLEDSLNKTPFKLRDKTILKFERDAADVLTIETDRLAHAGVRQEGHRLALLQAVRRQGRLQPRGRHRGQAVPGADDRAGRRRRHEGPEEIRARQAGGHGHGRRRFRQGDAGPRRARTTTARCTRATCRAR